jgi:hypothetical protein
MGPIAAGWRKSPGSVGAHQPAPVPLQISFLRRVNRHDRLSGSYRHASDGVERLSLKIATRCHAVRKGIPPRGRTDARRRLPARGGKQKAGLPPCPPAGQRNLQWFVDR